jgi:elongation factor Ts
MAEVSAKMVQDLRAATGAGMMDCKKALAEANGSMEAAIEALRKKGLKDLGKRAGKVAAEGTIGVYSHHGDQVVAIVELNCETDFVARGDEFRGLARDLSMHVAAMNPKFLSEESVPAEVIEKEKEILLEQLDPKQKAMADKIIPGRIKKFYEDNCLLCQPFVKDDSGKKTIKMLVEEVALKTGEKVTIRRFQRYEVGEGVAKAEANFADEVASMVTGN